MADESVVRRVIESLIGNAIKHTSCGVFIHLIQTAANVTIKNEAPHVTDDDLDKLFDRFYTADQTRAGKGTGLGLSIATSLMLKMGGLPTIQLVDRQQLDMCMGRKSRGNPKGS